MTELFVYGTLKEGGKWNHLMQHSTPLGDDVIKGEMYIDRYFPHLFEGTDKILGEVYDMDSEDYQRVVEMEGDEYTTQVVTTGKGREVVVFTAHDTAKRDPKRRVRYFAAPYYFRKWLAETPTDSQSWQEYRECGGKDPREE